MKTIEQRLPAPWASMLINGDDSGLDESEASMVRDWIDEFVQEHGSCFPVSCDGEPYFSSTHDAWHLMPLAGDVLDYTFHT